MKNTKLNLLLFKLISERHHNQEQGYAMVIVSILIICLSGLLASSLNLADLNKSQVNANADGASTFFAAESGLSKRIASLRAKFTNYELPIGTSPGSTPVTQQNIANCYSVPVGITPTSNEFECRNYAFKDSEVAAMVGGTGGSLTQTDIVKSNKFIAYTFVADATRYSLVNPDVPETTPIPSGQDYAGLNTQEYKYVFYSTAAKPTPAQPTGGGGASTILQSSVTIRKIPIFQFAIFSDGNSSKYIEASETIDGLVHSNGNMYLEYWGNSSTFSTLHFDYLGKVTASGDIYNRTDSANSIRQSGNVPSQTRLLLSTGTYLALPLNDNTRANPLLPLTAAELAPFNGHLVSQSPVLKVPDVGFLRKRNYLTGEISEYFGKADLRIEMVPDRAIPYDITSIQAGFVGGACTYSFTDPGSSYINSTRQGSTHVCNRLKKGQLMSLAQPVLVVTQNIEEVDRFCRPTLGITDRVRDLIGYGVLTPNSTMVGLSATNRAIVLKALATAIAAQPTPIDYARVTQAGMLDPATQATFGSLLVNPAWGLSLSPAQLLDLTTATPASIARAADSCFLPAPIAMVKKQDGTAGFYDRREELRRTILQTNIESLTMWNRDGRYVNMGVNLQSVPVVNASDLTTAATAAYGTTGALFQVAAADPAAAVGSFAHLGLAASDRTEGGLVLYATVNDNLSGDGSTGASNNVVFDTTKPIHKMNPDGTIAVDPISGNPIVLDYYRAGKGHTLGQGAYGFAINGGRNLPAPLSVVSDRPIYLQGDYNTYPNAKQPAAVFADTVMSLSNNCLSPGTTIDPTNVLTGQINCGILPTVDVPSPWTGRDTMVHGSAQYDAIATTYNSAFLIGQDLSQGNLGSPPVTPYHGSEWRLRQLENWDNYQYIISGSFIGIGTPLESNGRYRVYKSPDEALNYSNASFSGASTNYDTDFNDFSKLPPMTPMATYLKQDLFKRSY
ncbi:hypothetical protein [Chamaesiphon sp.]|uniref:hypothetical protein n=1 Tax=Chamaesiphon sp. TaxID=2814140 RepID=UPI003593AADC